MYMSSFSKILITLRVAVSKAEDLPTQCVYNHQDGAIEEHTDFIGGPGGSPVYATGQGRIHAIISWGISQELPGYDYDAVGNLQFESDMQYKNVVFGTDPVDLCPPFSLQAEDHIYGVRVIYRQFIHGLYFHTKNGLSYDCVANVSNISNYTSDELFDTGDIYVNNSYLSGFKMRTGGVIDAIDFWFTVCAYPTYAPTTDPTIPTIEPTRPSAEPTTDPTAVPTVPSAEPTMDPTVEPTVQPTVPTIEPTVLSAEPTTDPTAVPTLPSAEPAPTMEPTAEPTMDLTNNPTIEVTVSTEVAEIPVHGHGDNPLTQTIWLILAICFLVIIVLVSVFSRWLYVCCYQRRCYVVDNALVLIVAISKFESKKYSPLLSVKSNIKSVVSLWRNTYNYKVFVCKDTTKDGVTDFVDEHTKTLMDDSSGSYKAVIVHILSHGPSEKRFITSDSKTIKTSFINHELTEAARYSNNGALIKIIFYDVNKCAGPICMDDNEELKVNEEVIISNSNHTNASLELVRCGARLSNDNNKIDPNANYVTIYGTTEIYNGELTARLCNVFVGDGNNAYCSCLQIPKRFKSLIRKVNTDNQLCTSIGMATRQKNIIFKKRNKINKYC